MLITCPNCEGSGDVDFNTCPVCNGTGNVDTIYTDVSSIETNRIYNDSILDGSLDTEKYKSDLDFSLNNVFNIRF